MVVAHTFYPSTWEAEAVDVSEFQDSLTYTVRRCLKSRSKEAG